MKLLRLKITDPAGFRSLPCGFEYYFRTDWALKEEMACPQGFAPFICAGPNGSGKSNLLEVLAAIFFQLEILRVRRNFLPEVLQNVEQESSPAAFELEYFIRIPSEYRRTNKVEWAKVNVSKNIDESVHLHWDNQNEFDIDADDIFSSELADILLPQYVLGYSSGENEILSLPFFKMRFVQFDEYWNALAKQLSYPGRPDTRLAYLDNGFSQAILLCNLLFQDKAILQLFQENVGIEELQEFRIILRRSIPITRQQAMAFSSGEYSLPTSSENSLFTSNSAIDFDPDTDEYRINVLQALEGDKRNSTIEKLKRCATLHFHDEISDTLILDYWVNEKTKDAFRANFDDSALTLFQMLQVLLTLNLYSVSDTLKSDLYTSTSHYVSETIPILASDQRIMRFKFVRFSKAGLAQQMTLKDLSDGEHQLLHTLGLCLLFRETNSLFLLDEPETHFNPAWRASFITQLDRCLNNTGKNNSEMLITTHSPFLISDSKPNQVLVFNKHQSTGEVSISHPEYNTLGASINKITHETFEKRETIGESAQQVLIQLLADPMSKTDPHGLARKIMNTVGDSIERTLAVHVLLQMPNSD